ncbi:MAG: VOC family protein [Desulfosalsimonadaceae bacterium]
MTEPCLSANTILYCKKFQETLAFYRVMLGHDGHAIAEWFVEFSLNETAMLSIADESRARIKSAGGCGITLSLRTRNIDHTWHELHQHGLKPGRIKNHAWGANVFYLFDPEGHRIEIWQPLASIHRK